MKRNVLFYLLLVLLMVGFAAGCSRPYAMKQAKSMHLVDRIDEKQPVVTSIKFAVNRQLDIAEDGEKRISREMIVWDKDGKEEVRRRLALNLYPMTDNVYEVIEPVPMSELVGKAYALASRDGRYLFNHRGEVLELPSVYRQIDINLYSGFVSVITDDGGGFAQEIRQGSESFRKLVELHKQFPSIKKELMNNLKYGAEKYDTNLSEAEWEKIAKRDSRIASVKRWLAKDWYLYFGLPVIPFVDSLIVAGLVKFIELPGEFTKFFEATPGFGDYNRLNSWKVAGMIVRGIEKYGGRKITAEQVMEYWDRPLPEQMKAALTGTKNKVCAGSITWGEYWSCNIKYNDDSEEYNRIVEELNGPEIANRLKQKKNN